MTNEELTKILNYCTKSIKDLWVENAKIHSELAALKQIMAITASDGSTLEEIAKSEETTLKAIKLLQEQYFEKLLLELGDRQPDLYEEIRKNHPPPPDEE